MMKQQTTYVKKAAGIRSKSASHASIGETIALTMLISIASTCVAIGAWSVLAFFSSVGQYGISGVVSGFFSAVTGR